MNYATLTDVARRSRPTLDGLTEPLCVVDHDKPRYVLLPVEMFDLQPGEFAGEMRKMRADFWNEFQKETEE